LYRLHHPGPGLLPVFIDAEVFSAFVRGNWYDDRIVPTGNRRVSRKQSLRNLAVALVLFILAATSLFWWLGRPLDQRLAEIRARGEPVTVAELQAQSDRVPAGGAETARLLRDAAELAKLTETALGDTYQSQHDVRGSLTAAQREQIGRHEEQFAQIVEKAREAAARPHYRPQSNINQTMPVHSIIWQDGRSIFRALRLRALYELDEGHPDQAFEITRAMLAISRHLEQEPFIVGHLVAIACRGVALDTLNDVLQRHQLNDTQRAALDDDLARADNWDPYRRAMTQERVVVLATIDSVPWVMKTHSKLAGLNFIDQALAAADGPVVAAQLPQQRRPSRLSVLWNGPTVLLLGSYEACHGANARALAAS
jgi:hypothetical protein